eukprot:Hpha_TRINITY_DN15505_c0_g1::TRINITY_DN15505_c0_g1_i3::g.108387::m.108387
MFWHPSTNPVARWAVPFILVGAICSLISANVDPSGTYVSTSLGLMGQDLELDHLYDFSLRVAVVDIWNAGLYPLSVVIAMFSGTWAYTKLILLLWTWFVPPTLLPIAQREPILEILDFFGKYSLVDLYVMVMFAVSFRMHVDLTHATQDVLPPGFLVVDLVVNPGWGLYGYVIAIFTSVIIGHIEVGRHREIVELTKSDESERHPEHKMIDSEEAPPPVCDVEVLKGETKSGSAVDIKVIREPEIKDKDPDEFGPLVSSEQESPVSSTSSREPLLSHPYLISPFPKWMCEEVDPLLGRPLARLRWWAQGAVVLLLVVTMIGVVVGCFIHSFSFKFEGAAAYAVEITPGQPIYRPYSVASLPFKMLEQASGWNWPGYMLIAMCVFVTAVVCPILQFFALLVLWCTPLTLNQQKKVFAVNECLAASAAVEVFVIGLFAAILQLQQFTRFFVKGKCDLINEVMKEGALLGFYSDDQATCFTVVSSLEEGCWVLFGASVLSYIVYYIVNNAARQAIAERKRLAQR